jgi:hypothetical protein
MHEGEAYPLSVSIVQQQQVGKTKTALGIKFVNNKHFF